MIKLLTNKIQLNYLKYIYIYILNIIKIQKFVEIIYKDIRF